jgi:hypothetical protein
MATSGFGPPASPTSPLDYQQRRGQILSTPTGLVRWDGKEWVDTPFAYDDTGLVTLPSGLVVTGGATIEGLTVDGDLEVNGPVSVDGDLTGTGKALFTGEVTGNQPYWRFKDGNGQSLTAGATVTYEPWTAVWRGVTIADQTVGSVVIQSDGIYVCGFSCRVTGGATGGAEFTVYIEKLTSGGTRFGIHSQSSYDTDDKMFSIGFPIPALAGETIRARLFNGWTGGNLNLVGAFGELFFSGVKVSDY